MTGAVLWRMAARNLKRNLRRSLLTIAAVAFGLCCLIVFVALKEGLHREMMHSAVRLDTGSFQVHSATFRPGRLGLAPLPEPGEVMGQLHSLGLAAVPRLKLPALLVGPSGSAAVQLSGVNPRTEKAHTLIAERVIQGGYLDAEQGVLVGHELAESLELAPGDELRLMVRNLLGTPVAESFVVAGVFQTDLAQFNRQQVYLPISRVQKLLGQEGLVTEVAVFTHSEPGPRRLAEVASRLGAERYRVDSWRIIAADVSQLMELNDGTMNLLTLIVFMIVALGVANTMTTTLYERFQEFGVLAALGLPPGSIVRLVLREAFLLGLAGGLIGSLVGAVVGAFLARYGVDLTSLTSANQYFASSHVLHAVLRPENVLVANLVTVVTCVVAGLYPAWKASRLEPAVALRHI